MTHLERITTPEGMAQSAAAKLEQRRADHPFILGGLRLVDGCVVLMALECGYAYDIIRPFQLTAEVQRFNTWRTRQAANQFKQRWSIADVHVYDLRWADVLPADCSDVNLPADSSQINAAVDKRISA